MQTAVEEKTAARTVPVQSAHAPQLSSEQLLRLLSALRGTALNEATRADIRNRVLALATLTGEERRSAENQVLALLHEHRETFHPILPESIPRGEEAPASPKREVKSAADPTSSPYQVEHHTHIGQHRPTPQFTTPTASHPTPQTAKEHTEPRTPQTKEETRNVKVQSAAAPHPHETTTPATEEKEHAKAHAYTPTQSAPREGSAQETQPPIPKTPTHPDTSPKETKRSDENEHTNARTPSAGAKEEQQEEAEVAAATNGVPVETETTEAQRASSKTPPQPEETEGGSTPSEPASATPTPTEVPTPKSAATESAADDIRERIREIKHAVNEQYGNPINIIESHPTEGRQYMTALLGAMKAAGGRGDTAAALQKLEDTFRAVRALTEEPTNEQASEAPATAPRDEAKSTPEREPSGLKVSDIPPPTENKNSADEPKQTPQKEQSPEPDTPPFKAQRADAAITPTPEATAPQDADAASAAPQVAANPLAAVKKEGQIKAQSPQSENKADEALQAPAHGVQQQTPPQQPEEPAAPPASPEAPHPPEANHMRAQEQGDTSKLTPLREAVQEKATEPQQSFHPHGVDGHTTQPEAPALDPKQEKVDAALTQLLSEWSLFKRSGWFGTGPNGREHPLYVRIKDLPMSAVIAGRFEGATQAVRQNLTDYINGWRYEHGIIHTLEETFDEYLHRVIAHIMENSPTTTATDAENPQNE